MNKKIVYILANDKRTSLFINAILTSIKNYNHLFFVPKGEFKLDLINKEFYNNVIEVQNVNLLFKKNNKKILLNAHKVIISGLFGDISYKLMFFPKKVLAKTYLQFWGGDFYGYRKIKKFSKMQIKKILFYFGIKRCKAIINLINTDYYELCKVFPNKLQHFVGEMPEDSRCEEIITKKIDFKNYGESKNIVIGNSATKENHQIEIFRKLEHLKNKDIKIYCPLSYGNQEYAKKVAEEGKKIYGNKFYPIFEYMTFEDYASMLSSCSIGIFNNDRQQAMGNINILLKLGKKVFIRDDTCMWKTYYEDYKFNIFNVSELNKINYEKLFEFSLEKAEDNNKKIIKKESEWINNWNIILKS